ncbi:MAG: hypothetical protein ACI9UJ_001688 [bacterium]|jgi:hypothetical protein
MKIKKLLLVCREEIKDKWWNRLFHVFLYVTTATVLVGSFVFYFEVNRGSNFAADNTEKIIVDFRLDGELLNLSTRSGYIADCFLMPDTETKILTNKESDSGFPLQTETILIVSGFCGPDDHISILGDNFWTSRSVNILIDTLLIRSGYVAEDANSSSVREVRDQRTQGEWLLHFSELGQLDGLNLKAKIWPTDTMNFLFKLSLVFAALVTAIVWFALWESVIYRCILYIVYGKANKQSKT